MRLSHLSKNSHVYSIITFIKNLKSLKNKNKVYFCKCETKYNKKKLVVFFMSEN